VANFALLSVKAIFAVVSGVLLMQTNIFMVIRLKMGTRSHKVVYATKSKDKRRTQYISY